MKRSTTNPRNKRIKPTLFKECKANLAISDPDKAAEDLNAALEDGDKEVFRLALKNVIEAQGGISQLAEKSTFNQESINKILSGKANFELYSLDALLQALGFNLAIQRVS